MGEPMTDIVNRAKATYDLEAQEHADELFRLIKAVPEDYFKGFGDFMGSRGDG